MGFENILMYIKAIMLVLPLVEQIVSMIEKLFGKVSPVDGAVKKATALELAKASLAGAGLGLPDEVIGSVIDSVVGIKNQTGEFTHVLARGPPAADLSFAK